MGNPIKKAVFEHQLHKCEKDYEAGKEYLSDPYRRWIEENEAGFEKFRKGAGQRISYLSIEEFNAMTADKPFSPDKEWLCVSGTKGETSPYLAGMLLKCLLEKPKSGLVYGDEDMYDPALCEEDVQNGKSGIRLPIGPSARYGPWFKPDESPETLLSYFYYGSVVLLKADIVREALPGFLPAYTLEECTDRQYYYDFILYYSDFLKGRELEITHILRIIFHGRGSKREKESLKKPEPVNENAYWGYEPEYDACKKAALKRRGLTGQMKHYSHCGKQYSAPVYKASESSSEKETPLISVIIPSKDNVEMLKLCIDSIREKAGIPLMKSLLWITEAMRKTEDGLNRWPPKRDFPICMSLWNFIFPKCAIWVQKLQGASISCF